MDRSVKAARAEANAIAVATDHIGKVKAVMTPEMTWATLPNRSPIIPVMVTTSFSRSGFTSRRAISSTCTVSAAPYQIAEIPVW